MTTRLKGPGRLARSLEACRILPHCREAGRPTSPTQKNKNNTGPGAYTHEVIPCALRLSHLLHLFVPLFPATLLPLPVAPHDQWRRMRFFYYHSSSSPTSSTSQLEPMISKFFAINLKNSTFSNKLRIGFIFAPAASRRRQNAASAQASQVMGVAARIRTQRHPFGTGLRLGLNTRHSEISAHTAETLFPDHGRCLHIAH